eukprot:Sspe_Gene.18559::Locus_6674_Transcript_2_3_Confidence_0.333_Length_4688::g.18559::m.18559
MEREVEGYRPPPSPVNNRSSSASSSGTSPASRMRRRSSSSASSMLGRVERTAAAADHFAGLIEAMYAQLQEANNKQNDLKAVLEEEMSKREALAKAIKDRDKELEMLRSSESARAKAEIEQKEARIEEIAVKMRAETMRIMKREAELEEREESLRRTTGDRVPSVTPRGGALSVSPPLDEMPVTSRTPSAAASDAGLPIFRPTSACTEDTQLCGIGRSIAAPHFPPRSECPVALVASSLPTTRSSSTTTAQSCTEAAVSSCCSSPRDDPSPLPHRWGRQPSVSTVSCPDRSPPPIRDPELSPIIPSIEVPPRGPSPPFHSGHRTPPPSHPPDTSYSLRREWEEDTPCPPHEGEMQRMEDLLRHFPAPPDCLDTALAAARARVPYVDLAFPPVLAGGSFEWVRLQGRQLCASGVDKDPVAAVAGISSSRLWLSLVCLLGDPHTVICEDETNVDAGYATVVLGGEKILVDTWLPLRDGSCLLSFAGEGRGWIPLVEKAYAKKLGTYHRLENSVSGDIAALTALLTNGAVTATSFGLCRESLRDLLQSAAANHLLALVPRDTSRLGEGLYSIAEIRIPEGGPYSEGDCLLWSPTIPQGNAEAVIESSWVRISDLPDLFARWLLFDRSGTIVHRRQDEDRTQPAPPPSAGTSTSSPDWSLLVSTLQNNTAVLHEVQIHRDEALAARKERDALREELTAVQSDITMLHHENKELRGSLAHAREEVGRLQKARDMLEEEVERLNRGSLDAAHSAVEESWESIPPHMQTDLITKIRLLKETLSRMKAEKERMVEYTLETGEHGEVLLALGKRWTPAESAVKVVPEQQVLDVQQRLSETERKHAAQTAHLQQELHRMEQRLTQQASEHAAAAAELTTKALELEAQLDRAEVFREERQEEINFLRTMVREAALASQSQLQEVHGEAERHIASTEGQIRELQHSVEESLKDTESQLGYAVKGRQDAEEKLADALETIKQLQDDLRNARAELSAEKEGQSRQVRILEEGMEEALRERDELERRVRECGGEEAKELRASLESLAESHSQLIERAEELQKERTEAVDALARVKKDLRTAEKQRDSYKRKLDDCEEEIQAAITKSGVAEAEAEGRVQALKKDMQGVLARMEGWEEERSTLTEKVETLRRANDELQREMAAERAKKEALQEEINAGSLIVNQMEEKCRKLQAEREKEAANVAASDNQSDLLYQAEKRYDDLQREHAALRDELEVLRSVERGEGAGEGEVERLREELNVACDELNAQQARLAMYEERERRQASSSNDEVALLRRQLEEAEERVSAANEAVKERDVRLEILGKALNAREKGMDKQYDRQLRGLQEEIQQVKQRGEAALRKQAEEMNTLRAALEEERERHKGTSGKWKRVATTLSQTKGELDECKESLRLAAREIEALHKGRDEVRRSGDERYARVSQLLSDQEAENQSLRIEMLKVLSERNLLQQQLSQTSTVNGSDIMSIADEVDDSRVSRPGPRGRLSKGRITSYP